MSDAPTDGVDAHLISLCEAFVRHAAARTIEGDRLDGLPWSSEVNAGYLELNRDAQDYGAMLAVILAMTPRTLHGLAAKAHVISRHQRDRDAEPIAASILADDVLRLYRGAARVASGQTDDDARAGASCSQGSR